MNSEIGLLISIDAEMFAHDSPWVLEGADRGFCNSRQCLMQMLIVM
jgi:hypothetical protein